ncbi:hypothetical protein J830_0397, partial [Acinetobacter baumannii 25691_7]
MTYKSGQNSKCREIQECLNPDGQTIGAKSLRLS